MKNFEVLVLGYDDVPEWAVDYVDFDDEHDGATALVVRLDNEFGVVE